MSKPKVYVAGPWVFRHDAKEHAIYLRALVSNYGFEALLPIDNEGTSARQIKRQNEQLIHKCDYVVADCTPFRGVSMDVGTAFELGFAWASGKAVFMWSSDKRLYEERVVPDGMLVESFGLGENLMIAGIHTEMPIHPTIELALYQAREWDDAQG